LFQGGKTTKPDKAIVKEERFKKWWSEGKLDAFETIKFYLIESIK
jgi:hypothetical protein